MGLFAAAHELLGSGDLSEVERQHLREVMIWFNINLPSPRIASSRNQVTRRAIFWFKSEAEECLSRIWEMAEILRYHGYIVDLQKQRTLGNIIYFDQYQVAAFPSDDDE